MPYTATQKRAIAAKMFRQGKSRKEISAFFTKHKGTVKTKTKRKKSKKRSETSAVRG